MLNHTRLSRGGSLRTTTSSLGNLSVHATVSGSRQPTVPTTGGDAPGSSTNAKSHEKERTSTRRPRSEKGTVKGPGQPKMPRGRNERSKSPEPEGKSASGLQYYNRRRRERGDDARSRWPAFESERRGGGGGGEEEEEG